MRDTFFIFFIVLGAIGLIYFLYKVILSSEGKKTDKELQITPEELLEQLVILRKQKKHNIVESLAKNYLRKTNREDIRAILAKTLFDEEKYYEAIEQIKIIIKYQPDNYSARLFLAKCYLSVDKSSDAITTMQEILSEDSENIVVVKELAQAYFNTNQKKSALKMYQKLTELVENNLEKAQIKSTMAEIHVVFMEFEGAINQYKEILELFPNDMDVKKRLIELYSKTPNNDALIELAEQLVIENPDNEHGIWAMKMLMDTYKNMQNYEKALEYAELIKSHPLVEENEIEEYIAQILRDKGEFSSSIEMLEKLVQENPENIQLKKTLANTYEASKDFENAVNVYKKILDMAGVEEIKTVQFELSNLYSNWAINLFLQNENEACFKYFSLALSYCNQNPDIHYKLGNINKIIKNFNEAISQYKKAIEFDSQNADYYYALSECYEEIDSVYEQKKALVDCLKYSPGNVRANYKLGVVYELQNDTAKAISYMQKALELDESFLDAKYKLALMHEHTGNVEAAIEIYENILKTDPENQDVINNLRMLKTK